MLKLPPCFPPPSGTRAIVLLAALAFAVAAHAAPPIPFFPPQQTESPIQPAAVQDATPTYQDWIREYLRTPLAMDRGPLPVDGEDSGPPAIVAITAVEGDDLKPDAKEVEFFGPDSRVSRYGCTVSPEGTVWYFYRDSGGSKGGGYPVLSNSSLERLKALLAKLPDDHAQLPPAGRRLVIRADSGAQSTIRVYDRANLPDSVLEILRLCTSGIKPLVPKFNATNSWKIAQESNTPRGIAFTPDAKQIITVEGGEITLWDAQSHALEKTVPLSPPTATYPREFAFAPDGSAAIIGDVGDIDVRAAHTWKELKDLRRIYDPSTAPRLLHPRFSVDGKLLFVEGENRELLIFDTKTWERRSSPPQLPPDAIAYFPEKNGRRAAYISRSGAIRLWSPEKQRDVATLDENCRVIDLAFSPDQSLVAAVIAHDDVRTDGSSTVRDNRIAIWRTDDGALVHELWPFEGAGYFGGDVRWWPSGKYVLISFWTNQMFTEYGIGLWDAQTGRFGGQFAGCAPTSFALSSAREELAAICGNSASLWDVAAAIRQVENKSNTN